MMNEEMYIKSRMGDKNPFRVPEGYFDNFAAEMMKNLPEQPKQSIMVRMRPWMYAAACLLVAVLTATIYFYAPDVAEQNIADASDPNTESYMEEVADYVMLDNAEIYACLSENY